MCECVCRGVFQPKPTEKPHLFPSLLFYWSMLYAPLPPAGYRPSSNATGSPSSSRRPTLAPSSSPHYIPRGPRGSLFPASPGDGDDDDSSTLDEESLHSGTYSIDHTFAPPPPLVVCLVRHINKELQQVATPASIERCVRDLQTFFSPSIPAEQVLGEVVTTASTTGAASSLTATPVRGRGKPERGAQSSAAAPPPPADGNAPGCCYPGSRVALQFGKALDVFSNGGAALMNVMLYAVDEEFSRPRLLAHTAREWREELVKTGNEGSCLVMLYHRDLVAAASVSQQVAMEGSSTGAVDPVKVTAAAAVLEAYFAELKALHFTPTQMCAYLPNEAPMRVMERMKASCHERARRLRGVFETYLQAKRHLPLDPVTRAVAMTTSGTASARDAAAVVIMSASTPSPRPVAPSTAVTSPLSAMTDATPLRSPPSVGSSQQQLQPSVPSLLSVVPPPSSVGDTSATTPPAAAATAWASSPTAQARSTASATVAGGGAGVSRTASPAPSSTAHSRFASSVAAGVDGAPVVTAVATPSASTATMAVAAAAASSSTGKTAATLAAPSTPTGETWSIQQLWRCGHDLFVHYLQFGLLYDARQVYERMFLEYYNNSDDYVCVRDKATLARLGRIPNLFDPLRPGTQCGKSGYPRALEKGAELVDGLLLIAAAEMTADLLLRRVDASHKRYDTLLLVLREKLDELSESQVPKVFQQFFLLQCYLSGMRLFWPSSGLCVRLRGSAHGSATPGDHPPSPPPPPPPPVALSSLLPSALPVQEGATPGSSAAETISQLAPPTLLGESVTTSLTSAGVSQANEALFSLAAPPAQSDHPTSLIRNMSKQVSLTGLSTDILLFGGNDDAVAAASGGAGLHKGRHPHPFTTHEKEQTVTEMVTTLVRLAQHSGLLPRNTRAAVQLASRLAPSCSRLAGLAVRARECLSFLAAALGYGELASGLALHARVVAMQTTAATGGAAEDSVHPPPEALWHIFEDVQELTSGARALRLWRTLTAMSALALRLAGQRRREVSLYARLALTYLSDDPMMAAQIAAGRLIPFIVQVGWKQLEYFVRRLYVESVGEMLNWPDSKSAAEKPAAAGAAGKPMWVAFLSSKEAYACYKECILYLIGYVSPSVDTGTGIGDGFETGSLDSRLFPVKTKHDWWDEMRCVDELVEQHVPFGKPEACDMGQILQQPRVVAVVQRQEEDGSGTNKPSSANAKAAAVDPGPPPSLEEAEALCAEATARRSCDSAAPGTAASVNEASHSSSFSAHDGAVTVDLDGAVYVCFIATCPVNPLRVTPSKVMSSSLTSSSFPAAVPAGGGGGSGGCGVSLVLESRKDWDDPTEPTHVVTLSKANVELGQYDEATQRLYVWCVFHPCHAGFYRLRRVQLYNGATTLDYNPDTVVGSALDRFCGPSNLLSPLGNSTTAGTAAATSMLRWLSSSSAACSCQRVLLNVPEPDSGVHLTVHQPTFEHCFADARTFFTVEVTMEEPLTLPSAAAAAAASYHRPPSTVTDDATLDGATDVAGGNADGTVEEGSEGASTQRTPPALTPLPVRRMNSLGGSQHRRAQPISQSTYCTFESSGGAAQALLSSQQQLSTQHLVSQQSLQRSFATTGTLPPGAELHAARFSPASIALLATPNLDASLTLRPDPAILALVQVLPPKGKVKGGGSGGGGGSGLSGVGSGRVSMKGHYTAGASSMAAVTNFSMMGRSRFDLSQKMHPIPAEPRPQTMQSQPQLQPENTHTSSSVWPHRHRHRAQSVQHLTRQSSSNHVYTNGVTVEFTQPRRSESSHSAPRHHHHTSHSQPHHELPTAGEPGAGTSTQPSSSAAAHNRPPHHAHPREAFAPFALQRAALGATSDPPTPAAVAMDPVHTPHSLSAPAPRHLAVSAPSPSSAAQKACLDLSADSLPSATMPTPIEAAAAAAAATATAAASAPPPLPPSTSPAGAPTAGTEREGNLRGSQNGWHPNISHEPSTSFLYTAPSEGAGRVGYGAPDGDEDAARRERSPGAAATAALAVVRHRSTFACTGDRYAPAAEGEGHVQMRVTLTEAAPAAAGTAGVTASATASVAALGRTVVPMDEAKILAELPPPQVLALEESAPAATLDPAGLFVDGNVSLYPRRECRFRVALDDSAGPDRLAATERAIASSRRMKLTLPLLPLFLAPPASGESKVAFCCLRGRETCTTSVAVSFPFSQAVVVDYAFKHLQGRVYCLVRMQNVLKTTSLWLRGALLEVLDSTPTYQVVRVCDAYEPLLETEWKPRETLQLLYELALCPTFRPTEAERAHRVQMVVYYSSWSRSFLTTSAENRIVLRPMKLPPTDEDAESVRVDGLDADIMELDNDNNNTGENADLASAVMLSESAGPATVDNTRPTTPQTSALLRATGPPSTFGAVPTELHLQAPRTAATPARQEADNGSSSRSSDSVTDRDALHFNPVTLTVLDASCNAYYAPEATFRSKHLCLFSAVMYAESPWTMRFGAATNNVRPRDAAGGFSRGAMLMGDAMVDQPADFVFVAGEPVRFCVRLEPLAQNWPEDAGMEEDFFIHFAYDPQEWMVIGKQRERCTLSLMDDITVYFTAVPLLPPTPPTAAAVAGDPPLSTALQQVTGQSAAVTQAAPSAPRAPSATSPAAGAASGVTPSSSSSSKALHLAGATVQDEGTLQTPTIKMYWVRATAGGKGGRVATTPARSRSSSVPAVDATGPEPPAGEPVLIDVVQFRTWVRVIKQLHP